jgi:arylsulfatase
MDTVRADHLSCYGYPRQTTPGLDAFARDEATLYTQARSTGPFTLTSHASLLTGLFPGEHGASVGGPGSRPLRRDVPTRGERFARAGYRTGAIVANTPYLNRQLGFDRGFHHFDARKGTDVEPHRALAQMLGIPRLGHVQRDAERITELALEWIEEDRARPFFLMLNYLDAHAPLSPPGACTDALLERGRRLRDLSFEERHVLLYDGEILYLDGWLTRFREGLRQLGVYDDTLLVITSDHGHAFGDHGHWEHCWMLYEEQLRVPLLVKPAGGRRQAIEANPTTGVDVHDLLLGEAGLGVAARPERPEGLTGEWYPWPLSERDLRLQARLQRDLGRNALTWVRGRIKTIVHSDGEVEAYDLECDPGETRSLELAPDERERARQEAFRWWKTHPVEADQARPVDEGLLRDLRELGYG